MGYSTSFAAGICGGEVCSESAVLELVGLIYDAAGDPARWPIFLEQLGRITRSPYSTIYVQDLLGRHGFAFAAAEINPAYQRSYETHYGRINIYMICGAPLLRQGSVLTSEELCPDEEAHRSEFYNDWIVPQRMGQALNGVLFRDTSLTGIIGLIRRRGSQSFGQSETHLLQTLLPHLQRAVELHRRITDLQVQNGAATEALNRWPLGVILVNHQGRILLMNRSAEVILNQKDGLTFAADGLHAGLGEETAALRRLIRGALETSRNRWTRPGGALALARPSGKRPLNVLVTPVCANDRLFPVPGAAAAVFVSDPEAVVETSEEVLSRLYGLTPAEIRVARLLLQGRNLPEISDDLHATLNTVKTHARCIYDKTGVRGQAGLVRLLLSGPAGLQFQSDATLLTIQRRSA